MSESVEDTAIDLPLVNIDKTDVLGAMFVHTDNMDELYHVAPLRESGSFTEEEIEKIKKHICVISPITLTLYLHWRQMEDFSKLPDSEKERIFLGKLPDQFKARYKGNAGCRNAREVSPDEDIDKEEILKTYEDKEKFRNMSLNDYLRYFAEKKKAEFKEKR